MDPDKMLEAVSGYDRILINPLKGDDQLYCIAPGVTDLPQPYIACKKIIVNDYFIRIIFDYSSKTFPMSGIMSYSQYKKKE